MTDVDATGAAFAQLYDAHYGALLAYCLRRVDRADAEDAVAEVLAIAWRKLDDAPPDDKLRTWLYGIAYRVLGHQWRGRSRRQRLRARVAGSVDPAPPGPETVAIRQAQDELVVAALRRLRPADQEVLRLACWEELPHAEIADLLGISTAAVDQRVHRAKQRLARSYDRCTAPGAGTEEVGR